jgi:hypothetical protein
LFSAILEREPQELKEYQKSVKELEDAFIKDVEGFFDSLNDDMREIIAKYK